MAEFEFGAHLARKAALWQWRKRKKAETKRLGFLKDLAATYSRGSYTTTTIGKTAFDGRVRDGNGSDHSFIATKKMIKRTCWKGFQEYSLKTTHRIGPQPNSRVEIAFFSREGKKAIKPHDRLVLVR